MAVVEKALAPPPPRADAAALLAGFATAMLWGSAFVAIRAAGETISPGALALGRLLVSSTILTVVALARRTPSPSPRELARIAAYGVLFLGVYSLTLNAAERRVDAGTAAMVVGTGPLLIAVLAGIFLREGFPRRLFAGGAIALVGSSAIGLATAHAGPRAAPGIALLLIAVMAYAVAVVVQKSVLSLASAFQVTWLGCVAASIVLLPFAPALVREVESASATAIGWIVYLGVFPTTIGFATWTFALSRMNAGRMGAVLYLVPPIAVLLSWAILGEAPPWLAVAGGTLCLGGVHLARRDRRTLRMSFGLSRELWLVELGILLNYLGYGAVLPFEVIYLHEGRGFSLGVAGLVVGLLTGAAVVIAPVAGPLIDRFGARMTATGAGVALAAGYAGLAFAQSPTHARAAAALAGVGNGALNPSQSTLLAALAAPEVRHRATAVSRVASNAGIGIGGALGGLVAVYGLTGYVALFLVNALTYLVYVAVLVAVLRDGARPEPVTRGYRLIVRDRAFMHLAITNVAMIAVGWGSSLGSSPHTPRGRSASIRS